jgi:GrpB-like predicted nucleotidyltransferase (UPF0157 family)
MGCRDAWVEVPSKVDGPVQLAEYDPRWPERYEQEAAAIRRALGDRVVRLEHIGSTSVPGLAAKPIIDIVLAVPDPVDEEAFVPGLGRAGYRLVIREPGWHEHRLLRKRPHDDVNLHVYGPGCPEIERHPRSLSVKPLRKIEGGFAGGPRLWPRRRGCAS